MDQFLYSFLKITSLLATGLFGALALLTNYKDEQKRITKWGRVALGGILVSSGISLTLYLLETSRANATAVAAKAQAVATSSRLEEILKNAQATAKKQEESLGELTKLKTGLGETLEKQTTNLKTSELIAEGMKKSLSSQRSILAGNRTILDGVTSAVHSQGELLNRSGINLLAALSNDSPIKEGSWWLELNGQTNKSTDIFEFLFSKLPMDYRLIAKGLVHFDPYLGISTFVEFSYLDGKVVRSYPYSEGKSKFVPPELIMPSIFDTRYSHSQPSNQNLIFILTQKTTEADKHRSAAIAYRDLMRKRVVCSLSLRFEKEFGSEAEARQFVREHPDLPKAWGVKVIGRETKYQVKFEVPKEIKRAVFDYWQTNVAKTHLHLYLDNSAYLMISSEANSMETSADEYNITINFITTSEPVFKVGIEEIS